MILKNVISNSSKRRPKGFALIVTLSLMILLTVIAVGLLSLSSISLRSTGQTTAVAAARANAQMALMLAIGELQKNAGLDTRVTARADILDKDNAPLLGAWKSWEGTDHETSGSAAGRPISPGNYQSKKSERFLGWLVSGDPTGLMSSENLPPTDASASRIAMIGDNTLGRDQAKLQVHLDPVFVNNKKGAYAWWVGGENQKARLPQEDAARPARSAADWANKMKSDSSADPKPLGMESLQTDPAPAAKAITLKQTDMIDQSGSLKASQEHFFDLSTVSSGLLTNTATGGWRKDLSLFTEKYDQLPTTDLPLFRLTTEQDSSQGKATSSQPLAAGSMLYPWSGYRSSGLRPYEQSGAVASWANLADYALMYRKFGNTNSFSMKSTPFTALGDTFKYLHTVKPMPIVARIQWVYSYEMTTGANIGNLRRVTVKLNPVVTLWNPYNVTLDVGKLVFTVSKDSTMPVGLNYEVEYKDGVVVKSGSYKGVTGNGIYPGVQPGGTQLQFYVNSVGSITPGGTKVYSISDKGGDLISRTLEAGVGFTPINGHFIQISDPGGTQIYSPRSKTEPADNVALTIRTKAKLNNAINTGALAGKLGLKLVVREDDSIVTSSQARLDGSDENEMIYQMLAPTNAASDDEIALPDINISNITANGYPFMSLTFGLRAIDNLNEPGDSHRTNKLAKGFAQTSPIATYSDLTLNPSSGQRVNAAYDFNLIVHSATDDVVPNSSGDKGYLLTGLTAGTGLTRFIAADLPLKPLASLAELQGWDMRFGNPAPPFAYNVIGNSDATPLIAPNAVDLGNTSATNLQHDDSYCANHVLFDDWFVSSLTQGQVDQFGKGGELKTTYTDFVTGKTPLVNAAYQPIGEDLAAVQQSEGAANKLFGEHVDTADSWRKIASRLEVEGMFNVNSTSVAAWRALLGHARGQQVPHYAANGNMTLGSKTDHPVTRFSVAGDRRADSDSQGEAGDGRANATQFTGYRVFTEQMIGELAEKVVEQVRKRGPFLSLSEFVNRQLSNDKDLALAGAIQTALTQMEGAVNRGVDAPRTNSGSSGTGYKFPEAAEGSSAYGMPGWVRQADILRPLAPVLSARDDTFLVRSYGDARDANGKIIATAYCEAVVRRTRNYCDSTDAADVADIPTGEANKLFGRRFEIISFRWLNKSEI